MPQRKREVVTALKVWDLAFDRWLVAHTFRAPEARSLRVLERIARRNFVAAVARVGGPVEVDGWVYAADADGLDFSAWPARTPAVVA